MGCLLVPGTIFPPVARRDLFPRVVEVDCLLEVFHRVVVCAVVGVGVMLVVDSILRVAVVGISDSGGID
jgi:hypothetical protein